MMEQACPSEADQARLRDAPEKGAGRTPGRTLIAGSTGRMGQMLLRKAAGAGLDVRGIDQPFAEADLSRACEKADLAIVCVPARHFASVLRKVTPHLPEYAILADITSVKEIPLRQMERVWNGPVVGTHPLFGPQNKEGDELPLALVRGRNAGEEELALVAGFFRSLGCHVFETDARAHDRAMARIQNLNYITNVAYFAALAGQEELLPFLTPSFERRRRAAAKMLTEDGEMFSGLLEANPYSPEAAREFRRMLNLAASGDIELLRKRALWWFGDKAGGTS